MNEMLKNLSERFGDAKSRTIIIFVGAILMVALLIAVSNMDSEQSLDGVVSGANITTLAKQVESKPGIGDSSEEYNKLRYQKNAEMSSSAKKNGGSAVPTIVSDQVVEENSTNDLVRRERDRLAQEREAAYKRLLEQRRQEEMSALSQKKNESQAAALKARQEGFEALMTAQAKTLFTSWGKSPRQAYVQGTNTEELSQGAADSQGVLAGGEQENSANVIYKAGDIVFAVLETGINSDEPGPVMAKIVQGPLKGSKIIGTFQQAGLYAKKLKLVFNLMSIPSLDNSIAFNAVAIDANTARTALASHVDNHYMLRYGSMFASSFLEGMSDAILAGISSDGIEVVEGSIVSSTVKTTRKDQVLTGLGNVGKTIAENTDFFDRPPTITLDAGVGFGLLMISDLNINADPASSTSAASNITGAPQLTRTSTDDSSANLAQKVGQTVNSQLQQTGDVFSNAIREAINQSAYQAAQ